MRLFRRVNLGQAVPRDCDLAVIITLREASSTLPGSVRDVPTVFPAYGFKAVKNLLEFTL